MKYAHKPRDGQAFTIYALVCPQTLCVRYVGQTIRDLKTRTRGHTPCHFQGVMREWLESLLPERPIAIVLEEGTNRMVRFKSDTTRHYKGDGKTRPARVSVWFATIRETVWQKRFRRTLLNEAPLESPEVATFLRNPPLPWLTD